MEREKSLLINPAMIVLNIFTFGSSNCNISEHFRRRCGGRRCLFEGEGQYLLRKLFITQVTAEEVENMIVLGYGWILTHEGLMESGKKMHQ